MRPPTIPTTIPINSDDSKQIVTMKSLYNALIEYREPKSHRILIQLFMCLPSRKDFPGYYSIIEKPIAMNKIRERIEQSQYVDEGSCVDDFKLMFENCKFFNEDDSQIYKDAVNLEKILNAKRDQLLAEQRSKTTIKDTKEPSNNTDTNNLNHNATNQNHVNSTGNDVDSSNSLPAATSTNNSNSTTNSNLSTTANNTTASSATQPPQQSATTAIPSSTYNNNKDIKDNDITHNDNSNHNNATSNHRNLNNDHNHSRINELNGNEDSESGSLKVNHNHHNETSMDSSSNLSADLLASTPVEKCSLNTRRGRNSDAPKRQLLTGYIIYASEIRKQVIDKNPNQNFGDISRLVGNEWKALPHDIRSKYDQRALIHNKRVRERAQRELNSSGLSNGLHTPKMTKRKLAKLAKEQMRQHHLSIANHDESTQSPRVSHEQSTPAVSQATNSNYKSLHQQHSQPQTHPHAASSKTTTVDSFTQTTAIRFVQPPTKKRLVYSESFKRYIESLQVPNRDILIEETTPDRPPEAPSNWLGAGIGRHESPEAALWALRDFMLQDAVTMRKSMEPYL